MVYLSKDIAFWKTVYVWTGPYGRHIILLVDTLVDSFLSLYISVIDVIKLQIDKDVGN